MFSSRTNWPFGPNELTKLIQVRQQAGLPILDLTESNPTRCGFSYEAENIWAAFRDSRMLGYEPDPHGLVSARQAVVEYYAGQGIRIAPHQIFLTASTSEAYAFIFRLIADPGDELLVPQPSYPLFEFLARLSDLDLVYYPLVERAGWRIARDDLISRTSPRCRAILAVHPNNPTGTFIRSSDRKFLLEWCREKSLALIADEVFYDYALEPAARPPSFAGESQALVFALNGLSKISALPQMKCSWMVVSGPEETVNTALARLELIADTYLSLSTPVALALSELLRLRNGLQPQIMARIKSNLVSLDEIRNPGLSRLPLEGGWYAVVRLPALRTDEAWALRLLQEEGVLVHPGHFYDFAEDSRIVVSLLTPPDVFRQGIMQLAIRVKQDSG